MISRSLEESILVLAVLAVGEPDFAARQSALTRVERPLARC
jgi:hypothetical protein